MTYDPIANSPMTYMIKAIGLLETIDQRLATIEKTLDQIGVGMGINTNSIASELRAVREVLANKQQISPTA